VQCTAPLFARHRGQAQPGKWRDRRDFPHYGQDHAARMRDWRRAIAESERMAGNL